MEDLIPIYKENAVIISANSSNEYVPYLSVYLLSIKENSSDDTNYEAVILEQSISDRNKEILKELFETAPNFSLRFYNPSKMFESLNMPVMHRYLCKESYFRLASPIIFKNYKKVIFTDADLIFNENPATLYNMDMDNNCLLSAIEPVWSNWINSNVTIKNVNITDYTKNVLKLKNPHKYFNTGVMVLDINKLNEINAAENMLEKISGDAKYLYQDQCVINEVLQDKIGVLPFEWNGEVIVPQDYANANEDIKKYCNVDRKNIIHWIGSGKPWVTFDKALTEIWWKIARKSPFYEIIVDRKNETRTDKLKTQISDTANLIQNDIKELKSIGSQQISEKNKLKEDIIKLKESIVKTSEVNQTINDNIKVIETKINDNSKLVDNYNTDFKNKISKIEEDIFNTCAILNSQVNSINSLKEDFTKNTDLLSKQITKYESLTNIVTTNEASLIKIKESIQKFQENYNIQVEKLTNESVRVKDALYKTQENFNTQVEKLTNESVRVKDALSKTQEHYNIKIENLKNENITLNKNLIKALNEINIKLETSKKETYENTIQEALLLYNFKHNKEKYLKYKILKILSFGKLKQKYSQKTEYYKEKIEKTENIIRGKNVG